MPMAMDGMGGKEGLNDRLVLSYATVSQPSMVFTLIVDEYLEATLPIIDSQSQRATRRVERERERQKRNAKTYRSRLE